MTRPRSPAPSRWPWPSSACCTTSTPCSPSPSPRASASSTGCSAGARPRVGHAARRRARHRQVHAAAAGCWPWWPGPTPVRQRRGVPQQVRLRAERLDAVRPELWLAAETSLAGVIDAIDDLAGPGRRRLHPDHRRPAAGVVARVGGPGARVRAAAGRQAKRRGVAIVLVGHVTKDGALAGPARARARRRHRAVVRGRAPPRPAPAAGGQAPLRVRPTSWACSR